jgi:hypothetical protein
MQCLCTFTLSRHVHACTCLERWAKILGELHEGVVGVEVFRMLEVIDKRGNIVLEIPLHVHVRITRARGDLHVNTSLDIAAVSASTHRSETHTYCMMPCEEARISCWSYAGPRLALHHACRASVGSSPCMQGLGWLFTMHAGPRLALHHATDTNT